MKTKTKKIEGELVEAKAIQTRSVNALRAWSTKYQSLNQSSARARTEQINLMKELVQVRDRITSELPGYFTWKRISTIVAVPEPTLKFYYRIGSHKEVHTKFVKEGALYAFKTEGREITKRGRKNESDKLLAMYKTLALKGESMSNFVELIQKLHPTYDKRCTSCGFPLPLTMTPQGFKDLVGGKSQSVVSEVVLPKVSVKELVLAQEKAKRILPFNKITEKGAARQSVVSETLHP